MRFARAWGQASRAFHDGITQGPGIWGLTIWRMTDPYHKRNPLCRVRNRG